MKKVTETYSWVRGSRFKKTVSASEVVSELTLTGVARGKATPESVLKQARKKSSCLHGMFEWDDKTAAHQFRIVQAREILRSINITINKSGGEEVTTRYYVNVTHSRGKSRGPFYTIHMVLADRDLREKMIEQAEKELSAWRQRYANLVELTMIFRVIDRALAKRKTARGRKKSPKRRPKGK